MSSITINPGLEEVYLCESKLSDIKGDIGELTLRGYPLEEISPKASFEEMLYLMWNGELPTSDQLSSFQSKLADHRSVNVATEQIIRANSDLDPMELLRMALGTIRSSSIEEDYFQVVAKIPTILAYQWRLRDNKELIKPDEELAHVPNFITMLGLDDVERKSRALTTYLNSVIDHGMNASTFTARTIVSTDSDVVSAIVGAIGALKGPKHGGAPGPVLDMLREIGSKDNATNWLREELEAGNRLMGFGHRVYKARDPRAKVLSNAAKDFYEDQGDKLYELAKVVEKEAVELLEEYKPGRNLKTNVEFYTALVLNGIGIPADFFSPMFAMGRVGGWTAHIREQLKNNRLIRPRAKYTGDFDRTWTSIEER